MSARSVASLIKRKNYEEAWREVVEGRASQFSFLNETYLAYLSFKLDVPISEAASIVSEFRFKYELPKKYADSDYLKFGSLLFEPAYLRSRLADNLGADEKLFEAIIYSDQARFSVDNHFLLSFIDRMSGLLSNRFIMEYDLIRPFNIDKFPYQYISEFTSFPITENLDINPEAESVSFVYLVKGRSERTMISLRSMDKAVQRAVEKGIPAPEVLIVEEESNDQLSLENLDQLEYVDVRHVILPGEESWNRSKLANVGIRSASNGVVFLCDADFLFPGDFFVNLMTVVSLVDWSQASLAINTFETHFHHKDGRVISPLSPYGYMWGFSRNLAISKGGFNEIFSGHGFEDRDFEKRVLGGTTIYNLLELRAAVSVFHFSHAYRTGLECRGDNQKRFLAGSYKQVTELPLREGCALSVQEESREVSRAGYGYFNLRFSGESDPVYESIVVKDSLLKDKLVYLNQLSSLSNIGSKPIIFLGDRCNIFQYIKYFPYFFECSYAQVIPSKEGFYDLFHTLVWVSRQLHNVYIYVNFEPDDEVLSFLDEVEILGVYLFKLKDSAEKETSSKYFEYVKDQVKKIDLNVLDSSLIVEKIRRNIRLDAAKSKFIEVVDRSKIEPSFPDDFCALYLKNRYYNETGVYSKCESDVFNYFEEVGGHKNYWSEIISRDRQAFFDNPEGFLSAPTVVLLDPTCFDQRSGITTYLLNLYKFLNISRLAKNVLYLKNPFRAADRQNREHFRTFVRDIFEGLEKKSDNLLFVDSEAHYPGLYLDKTFKKMCVTHCSSLLASDLDGKLVKPLSAGLTSIGFNELKNISNSELILSPTKYHDEVQKGFYESVLNVEAKYESTYCVNYIHDDYIKYKPFSERAYDLVFLGRPQKLKGFDLLVSLAESCLGLTFLVITNDQNVLLEQLQKRQNVEVRIDLRKHEIAEYLTDSRLLIDLSEHHSCSSVLLEAINSKTPAVLRDIPTYEEVLKNFPDKSLFLFLSGEDIDNLDQASEKILNHLEYLGESFTASPEVVDKHFNDYLLSNYVENYRFYEQLLKNYLPGSTKAYKISPLYDDYLRGKRVINVVHSPALQEGDGKIIDAYDVVVRFNRSLERINPSKHGSRTDVLYSCINRSPDSGNCNADTYRDVIKPSGAWVVKAYPNLEWTGRFSFDQDHRAGATYDNHVYETFNEHPEKTSVIDIDWYLLIEATIRSRPNTGVLAILDLLQSDLSELYLKGYTFFKGGYDFSYRPQNEKEVLDYMAKAGHHNQYRQNLFLRKVLSTESRIRFDSSLKLILDEM